MARTSKTPTDRPPRRRRTPRAVVGTGGILLHDAGKPGHPPLDDADVLVPDDLYPSADPAQQMSDSLDALSDLAGGILQSLAPRLIRDLDHELRDRIRRSPIELNSFGYDPWGFNADVARRTLLLFALLYRYYFRVQTTGLENLPAGRVMVIPNHAGQIAIDAAMIAVATVLDADPARPIRGMGEYWLPTLPFFNVLMARAGGVVGTPKNARDILEHGEAVIAFPEGVRGMNKTFSQRDQLQEFGYGFMRLALETNTPIVPVAVVGSEEQAISIANVKPLADLLGMPAFPVLLNFFPLPVRYHLYFGEPMEFRGNANDEDEVIGKKVEQVKQRIHDMIQDGLRRRRGWFW
jgi:1-acyl-sn-glycerol-3-phosphate acyltransferase